MPHIVYDVRTRQLLAANDAALALYGYEAEEFLVLRYDDLLMPGQQAVLDAFLAGLPGSVHWDPQPVWQERTKSGALLQLDMRGMMVRWSDGRLARLTAMMDAAPRTRLAEDVVRSRAELAALVAAIPDPWLLVDAQGRVVQASGDRDAHPRPAPAGDEHRLFASLLPPDLAAEALAAVARAHAEGRPQSHQYVQAGAGGEERHFEARYVPMGDGCTLALVRDVTEAHQLAAARQAAEVAAEVGQRQAAFLARVSHELRTPLNAVLGFAQLLEPEVGPGSRGTAYLGHLLLAGRHMLDLVDDLLELQRATHGRLEPAARPIDPVALMRSCAAMLAPQAQAAEVTVHVGPAADGALRSDERALRQILLNLGSNAIKYGRRGGTLWLESRELAPAPDATAVAAPVHEFAVRDDGPGMDADDLARLFRPFERLGREQGGVAGSGLGLVISRQLAHALGGTLTIDSQPGVGTVARLRVPAGRRDGAELEPPPGSVGQRPLAPQP